MNYSIDEKSRLIETYREQLEMCLRKVKLLEELIQIEECEALQNQHGDMSYWADYYYNTENKDD